MKLTKEVKVGILTVSAILLFIFGYSFLKGRNLLRNDRTFYAVYNNVEGLPKSAPVTINGLKVGSIDDIDFLDSSGRLLVTFHVDESFKFNKASIASVYSTGLIGGKALAIIPDFESNSRLAKDGDTLKSAINEGLQGEVMKEFVPLKDKIENMVVAADSVLTDLHRTLNPETRNAISGALNQLNATLVQVSRLTESTNSLVADNRQELDRTIVNLEKTTSNFAELSGKLNETDIAATVGELEKAVAKMNTVLDDVASGKGSLGKLMTDDALYINLEKTTRQAEMLLQDLKLNPKRYVHFSVFGKRPGEYEQPESRDQ